MSNYTYTKIPKKISKISDNKALNLLKREVTKYQDIYYKSKIAFDKVSQYLPLGVASSYQHYNPFPLYIKESKGAYIKEIGDNLLLDLNMGFGSLIIGHSEERFTEKLTECIRKKGILYVMPSESLYEASKLICERFMIDRVRFTNSGTESLMYAIRLAKSYTKKDYIVKVEGGYHGGYDPLLASIKPDLDQCGDENNPNVILPDFAKSEKVIIIPYNNIVAAEMIIKKYRDKIAALVIEPIMENIGLVLPDDNYLSSLEKICRDNDVLLIFDEVKTGLTTSFGGAKEMYNVSPDLITLGKSIGGGLSIAAFGGRDDIMKLIDNKLVNHYGTYNGNPLAIEGVIEVAKLASRENLLKCYKNNYLLGCNLFSVIENYELPSYVTGAGAKGSVVWSDRVVKNYRDYKKSNFILAELMYIYYLNNKIATPPGLDEQWLLSFSHGISEINYITEVFNNLARELRS
jgi:glutamate-1-semialdehyde 2,1-aminomutase